MPRSRKRKTKRGGSSSRTTHSSKQKRNTRNVIIAAAIIGALALAGVVLVASRGGGAEVTTSSGLRYTDEKIGTGDSPSPGKKVTVHYTGTLQDGSTFDSSVDRGQPFEFVIGKGQVIKGWDEGVMTMKVGGRRKLIIPPELGYGAQASPKIPANSTLLFDVELLGVK